MKKLLLLLGLLLATNAWADGQDYGCDEINVQGQTYAVSSTDTSITVEEGSCSDDIDRALYGLLGAGLLYWLFFADNEDSNVSPFVDSNRIGFAYNFSDKYFLRLTSNKVSNTNLNSLDIQNNKSEHFPGMNLEFGLEF